MKKQIQILYFIAGSVPTTEDVIEAQKLQGNVKFRNASAVPDEPHSLEICDGVAGAVPKLYAEKFPSAAEAIAKHAAELEKLMATVGDAPAPKSAPKPQAAADANATPKPAGKQAWKPQAQ